jgi:hypothetical protein
MTRNGRTGTVNNSSAPIAEPMTVRDMDIPKRLRLMIPFPANTRTHRKNRNELRSTTTPSGSCRLHRKWCGYRCGYKRHCNDHGQSSELWCYHELTAGLSGSSSAVERQLPKLDVAGSIPVSRSILLSHRSVIVCAKEVARSHVIDSLASLLSPSASAGDAIALAAVTGLHVEFVRASREGAHRHAARLLIQFA